MFFVLPHYHCFCNGNLFLHDQSKTLFCLYFSQILSIISHTCFLVLPVLFFFFSPAPLCEVSALINLYSSISPTLTTPPRLSWLLSQHLHSWSPVFLHVDTFFFFPNWNRTFSLGCSSSLFKMNMSKSEWNLTVKPGLLNYSFLCLASLLTPLFYILKL